MAGAEATSQVTREFKKEVNMHININKKIFALVLTISSIFIYAPISTAIAIAPTPGANVTEVFNSSTGQGRFTLDNQTGNDIYAFVVGNNQATSASSNFWGADVISITDWVNGYSFANIPGVIWTAPDTTQLDWNDLFLGFTQVVAYWVIDNPQSMPVFNGTSSSDFFFQSTAPNSPFIVLGNSGNIVETGETTVSVVPIPAALWMFFSGALILFGFKPSKASL